MPEPHLHLARKLRKNPTDAERKLWGILRCRQLAGCRFRRQVCFEKYILDFVCFQPKIVIEVDGGQHAEELNTLYDHQRTALLESRGYLVLRFWNHHVLMNSDEVAEEIVNHCLRLTSTRSITHKRSGEKA